MNENSGSNKKLIISVVSIVLAIAIVVGAIWGINYFKTDAQGDSNADGKNDETGSTVVPGQTATKLNTYVDEYCEDGEGWIAASDMSKVLEADVEIEYFLDWFTTPNTSDDRFEYKEVVVYDTSPKQWMDVKVPVRETVSLDEFVSQSESYNFKYYTSITFKFKYDQQLKITGIRHNSKYDNAMSAGGVRDEIRTKFNCNTGDAFDRNFDCDYNIFDTHRQSITNITKFQNGDQNKNLIYTPLTQQKEILLSANEFWPSQYLKNETFGNCFSVYNLSFRIDRSVF